MNSVLNTYRHASTDIIALLIPSQRTAFEMTQINPSSNYNTTNDEIDLADLFRNLWRQRGLIIGIALFSVIAVMAFHLVKASFSTPHQIDYPISLTFLNGSNKYPNGTVFSPRDIISTSVLEATLKSRENGLSVSKLEGALNVNASNSLLEKGEQQLTALLNNTKAAEDVRQITLKALDDMQNKSRSFVTVSLELKPLGLAPAEGIKLAKAIVNKWAEQSIERGLMNVNISRPVIAFSYKEKSNLIDTYDSAEEYVNSLEKTVSELQMLSGANSTIVNGQSLSDISRALNNLKTTDISPLREFAYSNSASLSKSDPTINIRLSSRLRILTLEHERLTKLIAFYDSTLRQLARGDLSEASITPSNNAQISGAQFDQSFLVSLLDLGTKLGNVEIREDTYLRRTKAMEDLLKLEKEISFLKDAKIKSSDIGAVETVLKSALDDIETDLNSLQQQVNAFVAAYRSQSLHSNGRLYIADAAPQVRGAGLQIAKKATLTVALGLILGLMLGVMVALIRSAVLPKTEA